MRSNLIPSSLQVLVEFVSRLAAAGQDCAALQVHTAGAEANAFGLKRVDRAAQRLILRRDDAVAGDFPAAQHIAGQSGAVS